MPVRSIIESLPDEIRKELNQLLIENHFSGYEQLRVWLFDKGCQISVASICRHSQKLQKELIEFQQINEQVKTICEEIGDDKNNLAEVLTRLAQKKCFEVLMNFKDPDEISLTALVRAISELNRSSITVKKYRAEVAERAKAAAKKVKGIISKGGISEQTIQEVERDILAIA
jgi:hypothetical protein